MLLAACQPLPQPFSHEGYADNALLALPDHVGVVVLPVADAPAITADALAAAMADALHDANVPADISGGNRSSAFLQGRVEDDGTDASLIWELFDPGGDLLGTYDQNLEGTPLGAWRIGDPGLMQTLAQDSAFKIAALIQPRAGAGTAPLRAAVLRVSGAPGNGDSRLTAAMRDALVRQGVILAEPGATLVSVAAAVTLGPPRGGVQHVHIAWTVSRPDGTTLGTVEQDNDVPAGSLDERWDTVANVIAEAAAPGVIEVLRQARRPEKATADRVP